MAHSSNNIPASAVSAAGFVMALGIAPVGPSREPPQSRPRGVLDIVVPQYSQYTVKDESSSFPPVLSTFSASTACAGGIKSLSCCRRNIEPSGRDTTRRGRLGFNFLGQGVHAGLFKCV